MNGSSQDREKEMGIGDRYQQETKHRRGRAEGGPLDWMSQPSVYKRYPDAEHIELVHIDEVRSKTLDQTLRIRKSARRYSGENLKLEHLSYLLWACTGIARKEHGTQFRTAPSAGALYPIETYVISNGVDDLERGLYHYNVRDHRLDVLKIEDLRGRMVDACLGQSMCGTAQAVLVWTGIFNRSKWKYRQRAYRYVYLDAGHVGANLSLAAVSVGLASCHVGAFYDDEVNDILGVDGVEESAVYMGVVGHPR